MFAVCAWLPTQGASNSPTILRISGAVEWADANMADADICCRTGRLFYFRARQFWQFRVRIPRRCVHSGWKYVRSSDGPSLFRSTSLPKLSTAVAIDSRGCDHQGCETAFFRQPFLRRQCSATTGGCHGFVRNSQQEAHERMSDGQTGSSPPARRIRSISARFHKAALDWKVWLRSCSPHSFSLNFHQAGSAGFISPANCT